MLITCADDFGDMNFVDVYVEVPQKSERYLEMMKAAEEYYRLLRDAPDKTREAEERFAELAERFSDDSAYQAQLRLERAVRTGGDDAAG